MALGEMSDYALSVVLLLAFSPHARTSRQNRLIYLRSFWRALRGDVRMEDDGKAPRHTARTFISIFDYLCVPFPILHERGAQGGATGGSGE